jgi:hypothetical protein
MADVAVFVPAFTIDLSAARVDPDTGDWVTGDLFDLMGQDMVTTMAIALHEMAGHPRALAYACGSAHLRVLAARFRLAGQSSEFIESDFERAKIRQTYERLVAGRIRLLVTRSPYVNGPAIGGIDAVLLARPTRLQETFHTFLGRLQPAISIIDLADNIRRHGTPEGWAPNIIEGEPQRVLRDPHLDRLATMSAPEIQRWAEGDFTRLELGRIAKGYARGWSEHSRRGWLDKQVRVRGGPVRPGGTR